MIKAVLACLLLCACAVGNAADQRPRGECRPAVPTQDGYCPDARHRLAIAGCAVICRCVGGRRPLTTGTAMAWSRTN